MLERLNQRARRARKGEGGFTLIELLVVIVILGILAGIVVFSVQFVNSRGETAACKTDKKSVEVAVEAYYAQNGTYPVAVAGTASNTLVGAGVLKEAPSSTNYTITYNYADATTAPTITSSGC